MSGAYAIDLLWEWRSTFEKGLSPTAAIDAKMLLLELRSVGELVFNSFVTYYATGDVVLSTPGGAAAPLPGPTQPCPEKKTDGRHHFNAFFASLVLVSGVFVVPLHPCLIDQFSVRFPSRLWGRAPQHRPVSSVLPALWTRPRDPVSGRQSQIELQNSRNRFGYPMW